MSEITVIDKKEVALNKAGATREAGAKVIADAMSANKMTVDKFGEEHYEPDHTARLKAEEMRARYVGDLKSETVIDNRQVHISVGKEDIAHLLKIVSDVNKQLESLKRSGRQTGEIIDVGIS